MTTLEKLEELIYHGFKETDRRSEETNRRMQETDRRILETDRLIKENARQLQSLKEQIAGLTDSLGRFAEHMVEPSVVRLFRERGIRLTDIYSRFRERRNGKMMEVDVLGYGPRAVVVVEVKLKLKLPDIKDLLEKLPHFFDFFTLLRGRKLYGAVAGMSVDANVARYAYKEGLFVLAPSGENMQILNDDEFKPRTFGGPDKKPRRKKR
jgi:hypothetical protein